MDLILGRATTMLGSPNTFFKIIALLAYQIFKHWVLVLSTPEVINHTLTFNYTEIKAEKFYSVLGTNNSQYIN